MNKNFKATYIILAEKVQQEIQQGKRVVGDKMTSLRQFSNQNSVSMTTSIKCYQQLEEFGFLRSVEKSGFYIQIPLKLQNTTYFPQFKSEAQLLNYSNYTHQTTDSSPFSVAQISPDLLPLELLQKSINRVLRQQISSHYMYGDPQGSDALRHNLASHFTNQGFGFQKEDLVITNGCIDAISLALEVVSEPNDAIAVQSPCYNGLLQLIALMNRRVIEIPSTSEGIDLRQLKELSDKGLIKACIITANHQNPSGHSLSVKQKQQLAEWAYHSRTPIIEDDIYNELNHQGSLPLPIKSWDTEGWVIWCSSVSKSLSPGIRLGWCQPGKFITEFINQRHIRTLGVSLPIQEGLADFIGSGQYIKHLRKINSFLTKQVSEYRNYLTHILPKGTTISTPSGGTVLWIKISGLDSVSLAKSAEENGVKIRSGGLFSSRNLYQEYFRLNIGWPLSKNIQKMLNELASLCIKHNSLK